MPTVPLRCAMGLRPTSPPPLRGQRQRRSRAGRSLLMPTPTRVLQRLRRARWPRTASAGTVAHTATSASTGRAVSRSTSTRTPGQNVSADPLSFTGLSSRGVPFRADTDLSLLLLSLSWPRRAEWTMPHADDAHGQQRSRARSRAATASSTSTRTCAATTATTSPPAAATSSHA